MITRYLSFLCFCGVLLGACQSLAAAERTAGESEAPRFGVWEGRFPASVSLPDANPYDPEQVKIDARVILPSGKKIVVPAFYYQPYTRGKDSEGKEKLKPDGATVWAVRYAGSEIGTYRVRLIVKTGANPQAARLRELRFRVTESDSDGFLRLSQTAPGRFAFDSGKGYFAIGHNVCWVKPERGTYAYDDYFGKMAAAGENYTRVWLCTWGINLESKTPLAYDQADAWRLDHVLQSASDNGIYVKLCLDNFYDFRNNFEQGPYSAANGGPCAKAADFFSLPEARRMYEARLRYLVARYGAFTSLMAWELWNEMNYALDELSFTPVKGWVDMDQLRDEVGIPWTKEMAARLKAIDPYRHLVTTSLGRNTMWEELWKLPELDFTQYHTYIHYIDYLRTAAEEDTAALALDCYEKLRPFGKPALLAEFGYMGEWEASSMNVKDPTGIALHNSLWAGTMSGAAGVPMQWWWDNYIDPMNLYARYRSLSEFVRDVDWTVDYKPMRAEGGGLRVLALRSEKECLVWVQQTKSAWHSQIKRQQKPESLKDIRLFLENFSRSKYRARWFDTQKGAWIKAETVVGDDKGIRLSLPAFENDIAARLTPLE